MTANGKRLPPWEEIARASMLRRVAEVRDLDALRGALRDDRARYRFLERLRWPRGFVCSRCKQRQEPQRPRPGMCVCARCGYYRNVTTDSLFRDQRVSLERWLSLFWLLASGALPLSQSAVSRLMRVDDGEAQHILDHIADVTARLEHKQLGGIVELDAGILEAADVQTIALCAVESFDGGFGRMRIGVVDDARADTVRRFIEEHVDEGALLRTDCWSEYLRLEDTSYMHEPVVVPPADGGGLPGPALALRLLRRYLKLSPPVSLDQLELQANAFTLRFNRAHHHTTGEVFCMLVGATLRMAEHATRRRRIVSGVRPIQRFGAGKKTSEKAG